MTGDDDELEIILNAYLDGELDPAGSRDFERRLAAEPALTARLATLTALRAALRSGIADDLPSDGLRARIERQFAEPRAIRSRDWRSMAAVLLLGVLLGGGATLGALDFQRRDDVAETVVASHIRALMAPAPTDVLSSDRHTVKPWFDGKLTSAPEVVDLAAEGFPLVGGRIDVIGLEAVPVLVYRAGKHLISLTEIPVRQSADGAVRHERIQGFAALAWRQGPVSYWAVSDASPDELETFQGLLATALNAAPRGP